MSELFERNELRGCTDVFRDRAHAGDLLADLLRDTRRPISCVLAIPAGGVPVAVPIASRLGVKLDVSTVSKITLPWNTESGYGAVAFDASVMLNDALLRELPLSREEIDEGIARTRRKVQRRALRLRGTTDPPQLSGEDVVLVDDGLATGFTMLAGIAACRACGASAVAVAVPTAHTGALSRLEGQADWVACVNVRPGRMFAVADAYQRWHDVLELEVETLLARCERSLARPAAPT